MDWLGRHATRVDTPLANLGIGQQLQFLGDWLAQAKQGNPPPLAASHPEGRRAAARTPTKTQRKSGGARGVATTKGSARTSKYEPLRAFLAAQAAPVVELTFAEIHEMVGGLPRSAYAHRPWWSNNRNHSQASAWLDAGRQASIDWSGRSVRFRRGGGR